MWYGPLKKFGHYVTRFNRQASEMGTLPEIKTRRLKIVPFAERHLTEVYVAWLNNKDLMNFSEQRHRDHTIESCRAYMSSFEGTPHYFWAILETESRLGHIGNINAYLDLLNGLADVGILIGEPAARGKGLGLEAWKAVCDGLFTHTATRKITAGTMVANIPMLRIMERSGMVPDGRRAGHYRHGSEDNDLAHAALFREQWVSPMS